MGELVLAALAPHPPIVVPGVGGREAAKAQKTVDAMRKLAREVTEAKPDTVIVISPHAPVFADVVAINGHPHIRGSLAQFGADVELEFDSNMELASAIDAEAKDMGVSTAILEPSLARRHRVPPGLDHGTFVPVYFIADEYYPFRLVSVSMGVGTLKELYMFGMCMASAIDKSKDRVAVIASGDLSHRLTPDAPAGYAPEGKVFDEAVVDALKRMDVVALARLDHGLIEAAGMCGLNPIVMMLGALEGISVESEVLSYEGPFGVGYAVAVLRPVGRSHEANRFQRLMAGVEERRSKLRSAESAFVGLARGAVEAYVSTGKVADPPEPLPEAMQGRAGVFCSLHKGGHLRGCIGTTEPTRPNIAEEIIANAISAAVRDPRFEPVAPDELADIVYSVDVLSPAEPISSPEKLDPKRYGVIVRRGARVGLLLPDLEGVDTVEEQISIARRKAGIGLDVPVELERFEVTRYE
ncbi:MAG: AmmeMemoRadiSam system protein A [Firmicutes bacterium]|nr:AmmeMemoRadiSam system protein A [Bacillota bacterium]